MTELGVCGAERQALEALPQFADVCERLNRSRQVAVGGLWGSSQALLVASLASARQEPWIIVCSTDLEARMFADDLEFFGAAGAWLPARTSFSAGSNKAHADLENVRIRLQVAQRLTSLVVIRG